MTTNEKRIKIAEACGWTNIVADYPVNINDGNYYVPWPSGRSPSKKYLQLPDYFNDLNAMHEAVKSQGFTHNPAYEDNLAAICNAGDASTYWWEDAAYRGLLINATASQRAEAFGKTLNLW